VTDAPRSPSGDSPSLPRISVITPSYNQGMYIESTIQSVLGQGYPDLDYIVIDGGSTDSTLDVLRGYDGRLRWISERDRGQAHAINKGLRMTNGEIVAFLNSDDVYEDGALLRVGAFFAGHPQADWLAGRCRTVGPDLREIRRPVTWYKNFWLKRRSRRMLEILNFISQPATFWTRRVVDEVGEFDESLVYAMDYDYWLRASRRFPLFVIDDYLASFRVHPLSKAGSSASAQFVSDLDIARRHSGSRVRIALHSAHNAVVVAIYRLLLAGAR
jgi:glycosyltransferase involved in cell wall biosynthesis